MPAFPAHGKFTLSQRTGEFAGTSHSQSLSAITKMNLKEKIVVDFKEFFSKGKFDFLKLGKTKEWVFNNFPDPDGYEENPKIYNNTIWVYGNIELHFLDNELFLIFSDYVDELNGGESIELKKWFLDKKENLKLSTVITFLNKEHIDFSKRTIEIGPTSIELALSSSGVILKFQLEERDDEEYIDFTERCKNTSQDEFKLSSFALTKKEKN